MAYKQQARVAADAGAKLVDSSVDQLTSGDDCIRFNTMYTLKRAHRTLGLADEDSCMTEGFYGGGVGSTGPTTLHDLKSTADTLKGWKMFEARAPIIMGFTGTATGSGDAATGTGCKVAEYRLERKPMNFVKC